MGVESILKHVVDIAIASAEEERTKYIRERAQTEQNFKNELEQYRQSMALWLKCMYTIHGTWDIRKEGSVLVIDVDGNVKIKKKGEKLFDSNARFGTITGDFDISGSDIPSLKGCPETVQGSFYCKECHKLSNLQGAPSYVGGDFSCQGCTNLRSTKGFPKHVGKKFNFRDCKNLRDYTDAPEDGLRLINTVTQKLGNWKSRW